MRTLWNMFSFLAVVHLLALGILVLWLWQTQRLTRPRLHELREMLSMTAPEAQAAAEKAAADADAELQKRSEQEKKSNPPIDSKAQLYYLSLIKEHEDQARRRLEDDKKVMLEQVNAASQKVDAQKKEIDKQRSDWNAAVKTEQQRKVDEQFLQAVKQYEQVTPKQAKRMLMELVTDNHKDQAVAYLDAMNPRAASKILKEFKTDEEIALATELLEKLRTYGQPPPTTAPAATAPQEPSHANGLARAP